MSLNFFDKFFNTQISSAVFINDAQNRIDFCFFDKENNAYSVKSEPLKCSAFDDKFFDALKNLLSIHQNDFGDKVALILPDSLFLTDTIKLPFIQKSALNTSLSLALDALYGKEDSLKFSSFLLAQNKQHATFNVSAIRKEILSKFTACFTECSIPLACSTFVSNSAINACVALNPKLKNANFILLDIKDKFARFSFAIGGKTVGFYSLPFGFDILKPDKVVNELSLFDHTPADLLVLNAQEKAKKKNLTILNNLASQDSSVSSDVDSLDSLDADLSADTQDTAKSGALFRRTSRKLPKFMQRPTPLSENEFVVENFRIFKKWALELIRNNSEIFAFGSPDTIFVNIPENFSAVFPAEIEQDKVNFLPLSRSDAQSEHVSLELFGAFYAKKINVKNNF